MDGKNHWLATIPVVSLFAVGVALDGLWQWLPLQLLAFLLMDPDEDNKWWGGAWHRSILTHSFLIPVGAAAAIWLVTGMHPGAKVVFALLSVPHAVHLLADVPTTSREGKYLVDLSPLSKRKLGPVASQLWYLGNGLGLVAVALWVMYAQAGAFYTAILLNVGLAFLVGLIAVVAKRAAAEHARAKARPKRKAPGDGDAAQ